MKKLIVVTCSALYALACLAVDFQGPGGDMADPANWGGTLPDDSTAVSFGAAAVPSTGLTLSDHVAFGNTTVAAGFADGLLFDLAGYSYKGAALSVKSDATFQNGFFTNTTLSVASDKTLTLSGAEGDCELRLTAASTPLASGSTLHVTDGATFRPGGNGFSTTSSDTTMRFDKGATLDCMGMASEYNIAFLYQNVHNVELLADNATMKFFTLNIGGKNNGNLGLVRNSLFSFRNGSVISFARIGGTQSRGVYLGSAGVNSQSNRFEVIDSSWTYSNAADANPQFHMYGSYDTFLVSNSTFKIRKFVLNANGRCNELAFMKSSVSAPDGLVMAGMSNRLDVSYCSAFPNLTINGHHNMATFSSTNTSTITLGGTNNVVRLVEGGYMTSRPSLAGDGQKTFDVCGGDVYSTSMTIAGTNFSYVIRDGGALTFGNGSGVLRDLFNFVPNASSNAVLRIQDGGAVHIKAMVNFTGNESYAYNWTNCPACAIEFSGASPLMEFSTYSANYEVLGLGTRDEDPLTDPVALRFVVPDDGWPNAPLRNIGERRMWIYGNQPIEVEMASGKLPKHTMRVPLIYDKQNFNAGAGGSHPKMTNERLALLNANAKLPEGASLYYDSSAKTLGVKIPGMTRLIIVIK